MSGDEQRSDPQRREVTLEGRLAADVAAYIRAPHLGIAFDAEADKRLNDVCASIEWFLGKILAANDSWNPYYWVDGILSKYECVCSPTTLEIRGELILAEGGTMAEWLEPFFAMIRVAEAGHSIEAYEFRIGDRDRGSKRVRYGSWPKSEEWYHPREWVSVVRLGEFL